MNGAADLAAVSFDALVLFIGLPCLMVGVWLLGQLASAGVRRLKRGPHDPERPLRIAPDRAYGFPVVAAPALPVREDEDGPGRYRVVGVVRETGMDVKMHIEAATLANAKVKAELKGVVVTAIEKEL